MFWLFGHVGKQLDKKAKVVFKICDVKNWEVNNYNTHIANISRSKGNQTRKFDQLINYNRNIFLDKSCTKCGGETSPKPFFKKSKLSVSLEQQSEVS